MTPTHAPAGHPSIPPAKTGILIANLGTPDGYDYWSMRRYLNQFLSDKRVIDIPNWKWEDISMDFVSGLPRTRSRNDSIWVIVDRLTKSAHFLPVKKTSDLNLLARLYQEEIVRFHEALCSIVSDRDSQFASRFWTSLQEALGTKISISTTYHP